MALYLGLMSGTSLDGADGVLAQIDGAGQLKALRHDHEPFAATLRDELFALNGEGRNELHRAALAANALVRVYAQLVQRLVAAAGLDATHIRAIGAHGQTVRHRPGEFDGTGYTLQLNNGALLAELTGIDVVCDFRSRDVAAGGQGAPLVPAFHAAMFARAGEPVAVLNLGGISNLSLTESHGPVRGFDCGPGNALLDLWCARHLGKPYDDDGHWAAGGRVLQPLLSAMLAEPFLSQPPPKSTGRDLFNAAWLDRLSRTHAAGAAPQDVQATLAEFTVQAVSNDLRRHASGTTTLLVCGGGALNGHLMRRLAQLNASMQVGPTDERGLPAMQVEAAAFAWLAHAFIERQPANRVEVTGARGPRLLGALYPAQ